MASFNTLNRNWKIKKENNFEIYNEKEKLYIKNDMIYILFDNILLQLCNTGQQENILNEKIKTWLRDFLKESNKKFIEDWYINNKIISLAQAYFVWEDIEKVKAHNINVGVLRKEKRELVEKERLETKRQKEIEKEKELENRIAETWLIDWDEFQALCKKHNIEIHIRTKGFINSRVTEIDLKNNQYRYKIKKWYSSQSSEKLWLYIFELSKKLYN